MISTLSRKLDKVWSSSIVFKPKGGFGEVFKAEHKETKQLYAIKRLNKAMLKKDRMVTQIKTEIKIMYSLHYKYIIKLYNHFEENDYIYLVLEFAEGVKKTNYFLKIGLGI